MKITKYILLSTTVLGLVNPLVALADTNVNNLQSSSTGSVLYHDTEAKISSQANESTKGSSDKQATQDIEKKFDNKKMDDSRVAADSQTFKWQEDSVTGEMLSVTLDDDGTLHLPAGNLKDPSPLYYALDSKRDNVKKIIVDGPLVLTGHMATSWEGRLFQDLNNVTYIDLSNLDTSAITDMSSMFYQMRSLTELDLSGLNTSKVTSMRSMFQESESLKVIKGLDNLDTSNVTDMGGMFATTGIESLNLSNFKTSNVTNMVNMFAGMKHIDSIDVSNFDTKKVTDMSGMFANTHLKNINVSGLNTESVTAMRQMFGYNDYLEKLDLSNFKVTNSTYNRPDISGMFNRPDISGMFKYDYSLRVLTLNSSFESIDDHLNNENPYYFNSVDLPEHGEGDDYTDKWQNLGGGTESEPRGKNIWLSSEFMNNFDGSKDADTYIWQPRNVKAADVTAIYVDKNGKEIAKSEIKSGNIGDAYNTEKKDIKGYVLTGVAGKENGEFTDKAQTVTYIYDKTGTNTPSKPVSNGNVMVRYVDESNKEIAKSDIIKGKAGDAYTTEKKDIAGYTFKEVQGNTTGNITAFGQTVTYIYTKNPIKAADVTVKYVDENGKEIAKSELKSGNVGDKYTTEKKDITGYTFKEVKGSANGEFTDKAQNVTYIYTKNPEKGADVTVKYVDEDGKEIAKSEVKSGNVGDKYMTEKKDIAGYTFKEVQGSANGEFTDKAQTVTYIYTKNDDNVKPSDPSQPAKPDTPDHSGDTDKPTDNNSNSSEQPGNNSTGNDVVNNVVQSVLPKTAAEKVTLAGIVSVVLASLVGLVVWKRRK